MSNTEMIMNPDGSIYHLGLFPHELADIIITVGDPKRVGLISTHFDEITFKRDYREFVTHGGRVGNRELMVISTGIGTDNVDIVINELHYLHRMNHSGDGPLPPLKFIRLGTSGIIRKDIPINTILLTDAAIGMDSLLHFYAWDQYEHLVQEMVGSDQRWNNLPRPYATYADGDLIAHFQHITDLQGITLTAPGFYGPQGREVNLPLRQKDFMDLLGTSQFGGEPILNIEMETSGIYGLSELLGHKAVSLSAILANRATGEFSEHPYKIIDRMIEKSLEVALTI